MTLLVASAVAITLFVGAFGQYQMNVVYEKANYGNQQVIPRIVFLNQAYVALGRFRAFLLQYLVLADQAKKDIFEEKMSSSRKEIEDALEKYAQNLTNEKDRELLQADRNALATYYENLVKKAISLSQQGKTLEAQDYMIANQKYAMGVMGSFNNHVEFNVSLGNESSVIPIFLMKKK